MVKQKISLEQKEQILKNLSFVDLLTKVGLGLGYRIVIAGGYAVDGALGEITRPHNDLDIQIYGKNPNANEVINTILTAIKEKSNEFSNFEVEDKGRKEYYHNVFLRLSGIVADTYYMQTSLDPFSSQKIIVKSDGSKSETHEYETQNAALENVQFEIQIPLVEIVDKIYKRDYRGDPKQAKHEQDIKNLEYIVPKQQIQEKLQKMVTRN